MRERGEGVSEREREMVSKLFTLYHFSSLETKKNSKAILAKKLFVASGNLHKGPPVNGFNRE